MLRTSEAEWKGNLKAGGGGYVIRAGRTFKVGEPRLIDTSDATVLRRFSRPTRRYCRLADKQVILDIRERQPGFGPRPHAP